MHWPQAIFLQHQQAQSVTIGELHTSYVLTVLDGKEARVKSQSQNSAEGRGEASGAPIRTTLAPPAYRRPQREWRLGILRRLVLCLLERVKSAESSGTKGPCRPVSNCCLRSSH